jgi:hypothetical protein
VGRALKYVHELRLAGVDKAGQLQAALEWMERGEAHD